MVEKYQLYMWYYNQVEELIIVVFEAITALLSCIKGNVKISVIVNKVSKYEERMITENKIKSQIDNDIKLKLTNYDGNVINN